MIPLRNAVLMVLLFALIVFAAARLIQEVLPFLLILAVFALIGGLLFRRS